jgi:hypothetical protein
VGSLVLDSLTSLLNTVFREAMPVGIRPFWVRGPVTPLLKPQGGIRPIAVGSMFWRLASKVAVRSALPVVGPYLRPLQVGVGVRGGGEALVHAFNRVVEARHHDPSLSLLQLDFQNAFGLVSRAKFLAQIKALCPGLLPYVVLLRGEAHFFVGQHGVSATRGVHQGDPLAALLFALAIHPFLLMLAERFPDVLQGLRAYLGQVIAEGPSWGFVLNLSKSLLWWPTLDPCRKVGFPAEIRQSRDLGVRLLEGPLSASRVFVSAFVGDKAKEVGRVMGRLAILDDPQVELLLLRACMGLCRMVHVLRCSPPQAVAAGVAVFDDALHSSLRRIVVAEGPGFGSLQAEIAALPLSAGGLGIVRAE